MRVRQWIEAKLGGRYGLLLLSLIVVLVSYPLCVHFSVGRLLLHCVILLALIELVFALSHDPLYRLQGLVLGGATLVLACVSFAAQLFEFNAILFFKWLMPFGAAFFAYMASMVLRALFKQDDVNVDMLCGAVVAYLLIGLAWTAVYCYIELLAPGSFSFGSEVPLQERASSLFYYSFVTLTTLGYGDVLPLSKIARTVAYLEAVVGVMYSAILVAVLVSNFKSSNARH
jgi:hypothetical protein